MKLNIPTSSKKDVEFKLGLVSNKISNAILKNLLEKNPKFFNELSRGMTKAGVGSRRSVHIWLSKLENAGMIESEMKPLEIKGRTHWVRQYRIAPEHKPWIMEICS